MKRNSFRHEVTEQRKVGHPNVIYFVGAVTHDRPMMIVPELHEEVSGRNQNTPSVFMASKIGSGIQCSSNSFSLNFVTNNTSVTNTHVLSTLASQLPSFGIKLNAHGLAITILDQHQTLSIFS